MIEGPLTQADLSTTFNSIYNNGTWDTSSISLNIPSNIRNMLLTTFIPPNSIKEDKMIKENTSNGLYNTKSAYSLIANIAS